MKPQPLDNVIIKIFPTGWYFSFSSGFIFLLSWSLCLSLSQPMLLVVGVQNRNFVPVFILNCSHCHSVIATPPIKIDMNTKSEFIGDLFYWIFFSSSSKWQRITLKTVLLLCWLENKGVRSIHSHFVTFWITENISCHCWMLNVFFFLNSQIINVLTQSIDRQTTEEGN